MQLFSEMTHCSDCARAKEQREQTYDLASARESLAYVRKGPMPGLSTLPSAITGSYRPAVSTSGTSFSSSQALYLHDHAKHSTAQLLRTKSTQLSARNQSMPPTPSAHMSNASNFLQ